MIEHQAIAPEEVLSKLIEIFYFASEFVHFSHHGHHHIEGVGPPPEVRILHRALMAHHFDGAGHLIGGRYEVVHVDIGLEANLPVAEEDKVLSFAVGGILPVADVVALGAFPLVMAAPLIGVGIPVGTAREAVGLHVAGVIGSMIPEGTNIGSVVGLPVVVDLDYHVQDFARTLSGFGEGAAVVGELVGKEGEG